MLHKKFLLLAFLLPLLLTDPALRASPRRAHLRDYLPDPFKTEFSAFPEAEVVAVASFPANDFAPGTGNGLLVFKRDQAGKYAPTNPDPYPLKVAARDYKGPHTWYKRRFLKSPVGVFGVHRGTRNGSKYVSWVPAVRKKFDNVDFVPALGIEVPDGKKPQSHFHYAVHSLPPDYDRALAKKKAFTSLGCWSLLLKDMRKLYTIYKKVPTKKRVFISIYDTISIDVKNRTVHIYKDIYGEGSNTLAALVDELKRAGISPALFDEKKLLTALNKDRAFHRTYSFRSLM